MADKLYLKERTYGGGRIYDAATGQSQNGIFGRELLPQRTRTLTQGTASGQASKWHLSQRTLAATTFDLLDLYGGLTDYKGAVINFTKIKRIFVAIISPDGTKSLRIGPQNQTHAIQLHWGGTGATVYSTTTTDWELYEPYTGYTVTDAVTDIFPIYNPGAGSVTYTLFILGLG